MSLVGLGRVELPTSRLSGVRSNQLSYRPIVVVQPTALLNTSPLTIQRTKGCDPFKTRQRTLHGEFVYSLERR